MKNMSIDEKTIDIRSENGVITAFIRQNRECILSFPLSAEAANDLRESLNTFTVSDWRIRDAADDLLAALKGLKGLFDAMGGPLSGTVSFKVNENFPLYGAARAAVAKAQGRQ